MFKVFYRCEQSEYIQKLTKERYTTIDTYLDCETKKEAWGLAVTMNNYIKKFHSENFGKKVYYVKEVK